MRLKWYQNQHQRRHSRATARIWPFWSDATAQVYVAATAGARPNQPHEQLRRTKRYMWVPVAWPGAAVRPNASFIAGARASCSLNRRQARYRELPCFRCRPAHRPAARAPISIARTVGRASAPPPRAARSDARRLGVARAIGDGAVCAQMLATALREFTFRRPFTRWPSNRTSRRAESRATGRFDGECNLHEAAECHRQC